MIGGQRENNLRWAGDEIKTGLLLFYGTEQAKQIDKHDTVCKFRLVVEAIDYAPIFGNRGEGKNVVQIEVEGGVDVINQGIDILFRALVERNDGERRASTTMHLENALVIFDRFTATVRGGDDDMGATREETFDNFNSDRALSNTGEKGILVFEGGAGCRNFVEGIEIDTCEVAGIFPCASGLALEMK